MVMNRIGEVQMNTEIENTETCEIVVEGGNHTVIILDTGRF